MSDHPNDAHESEALDVDAGTYSLEIQAGQCLATSSGMFTRRKVAHSVAWALPMTHA
jgi:hypothetical protein